MTEELPEDTIVDLSQPGVIHYIYPTGRKIPKHMMNPNIGGNFAVKIIDEESTMSRKSETEERTNA